MPAMPVLLALAAALLFGASTPLAKLLLGTVDPWALAAILYLGSGLGLFVVRLFGRRGEAALRRADLPWLAGAILSGGLVGPVLLMLGLARTPGNTASLLLTLEGVATALIAWFAFRENFDRRIALGMAFIVAGSVALAWRGGFDAGGLLGPLAIAGACVAWGLDNNLTRKVSLADPMQIAMLKGLVAGPVSLALAVAQGAALPSWPALAGGALVGFLGYGLSLACFVLALRGLGSARTGAYFSIAPFAGALLAVPLLHEPLTAQVVAGGALMAIGVWLHLTERHEHDHEHEALEHAHRHTHDIHHQHLHAATDPAGEPHVHRHVHTRLRHRHRHPHTPDSHHQHRH